MARLIWTVLLAAGLACSQDPTLLVLHKGASSLGFYSMDGKLQTTVETGKHPHEMVFSADGRHLYITDNGTMRIEQVGTGGNTVTIVDVKARKKIGEISLGEFRRPHGLNLDGKTGRVYVSCELPDRLLVLDAQKRQVVRTYDTKGKTSHMVTLGPEGRWAYVSNSSSGHVAAIELSSGAVKLIPTGERPEGSVLSPDGKRLYVVNREGNTITVIDTGKQEAAGQIQTGKGPVRIGRTPDGRLLVYALIHDNAVEFADAETRKVLGRVALSGSPVSLNLSPDGKLAFAAAQDIGTVYVVSVEERKLVREFKTAAEAYPDPVLMLP